MVLGDTSLLNIQITKAIPDDAEGIKNVQYCTWIATYPNDEAGISIDDVEDRFKDRLTPEAIQKQRDKLANPGEGISVFVAKDGTKVVGVCAVEAAPSHNQLNMLYVQTEYQGKKIGWALWEEGRKLFNPENPTFVNVADYNTQAIRFYEKIGFVTQERDLKIQNTQ